MKIVRKTRGVLQKRVKRLAMLYTVKNSIKHLFGLKKKEIKNAKSIVLCLVKNGEFYIPSFMQHYFSLGVDHIVFLDNNSDDRTLELLANTNNNKISVYQTKISKHDTEAFIKDYLFQKFGKKRWCLLVDIDELFDYPGSDKIAFSEFLKYLESRSFTAVVAQMLDMFSSTHQKHSATLSLDELKQIYTYYDIANVKKLDYLDISYDFFNNAHNQTSNPNIKFYFGGIRKAIFGIDSCISKHPLIYGNGKIKITHPHCVRGARCADVTGLLLHYKFAGEWIETIKRYISERSGAQKEYEKIFSVACLKKSFSLKDKKSVKHENMDALINDGFITLSEEYLKYLNKNKAKAASSE